MRMNKTEGNLKTIWEQLDNACGELDNALTNLGSMVNLPDNVQKSIEKIDFSSLVSLKNDIEELIEEKVK